MNACEHGIDFHEDWCSQCNGAPGHKKYKVVQLKRGYAVQNTATMSIVFTSSSKEEADRQAEKLNRYHFAMRNGLFQNIITEELNMYQFYLSRRFHTMRLFRVTLDGREVGSITVWDDGAIFYSAECAINNLGAIRDAAEKYAELYKTAECPIFPKSHGW